jgi:hypothetical protein
VLTIDDATKVVQMVFYTVAAFLAALTYRSAKRGLLNTVNTEYQKRVMDRLHNLAEELYSEFDPHSESYWAKSSPVREVVEEINKEFRENRSLILKEGEFKGPVLVSSDYAKLNRFVNKAKSDPFLPKEIRDKLIDLLEARVETLGDAYEEVITDYANALAQGKYGDTLDDNCHWVHNKIIDVCYKRGCGISQIEEEVHRLRLFIQKYLESFNPFHR